MKTTTRQNIARIRETIGTGPVRPSQEPVTVKKKAAVGPREEQARALREEQARAK